MKPKHTFLDDTLAAARSIRDHKILSIQDKAAHLKWLSGRASAYGIVSTRSGSLREAILTQFIIDSFYDELLDR